MRRISAGSDRPNSGGGRSGSQASCTMKTIIRRLGQLEVRLVPKIHHRMEREAAILRERRRRRLEASDLPIEEELDWSSLSLPSGTRLSRAETLQYVRQLRLKRNRERAERAGECTRP
jgi:hypothetical protein